MQEMTTVFGAVEKYHVSMVTLGTKPRASSFTMEWRKTPKSPRELPVVVEIGTVAPQHREFVRTTMLLAQADAELLGARGEAAAWQKLIDKITAMIQAAG